MPLDKFVLILVAVIAAAGLTVWLATLIATFGTLPIGWVGLIPAALVLYVVWRVIADRLANKDDSHYDGIEK
jgi:membrane protein implicated in regulation of membrane protease activity